MPDKKKPWVLITGANGGIGKALVSEFCEEGYNVLATDISQVNYVSKNNVAFLPLDLQEFVVNEEYANSFAKQVSQITDSTGLTALVNNAAVQILNRTEDFTREKWQKSFDVNLSAPFFLIQLFLVDLSKNKGSVVNISSIHATQTKKEFVAYATTKAGLSSLSRNLALDLGSSIRVNAIEPAAVATDMLKAGFEGNEEQYKKLNEFHPIGRIALSKEIAELAVFLCSKKAQFVQGACISASGGIQGCLSDP
ncbi:SDR family NAD(P)-dependent oxidoreductase [Amphritea sp.]|uniref:SDR family NAD(P)-dependent oxidoreductase n=1 Tax=Amphritea sp. TaxID=1872502 RepID=UPI003A8FCAF6